MTASTASEPSMTMVPNDRFPQWSQDFHDKALDKLKSLSEESSPSSARFTVQANVNKSWNTVLGPCFHQIAAYLGNNRSMAVCYMGYGGFIHGDRWRKATMEDLATHVEYPFVLTDVCHYNSYSLEYLKFLLDPEGPFKGVLPHLYSTDPEEVQANRGFIFPDAQELPPALTWCFLIASRVGVANARVFWKYLLLKEMGFDTKMASLMAGGFDEEMVKDASGKFQKTGRIIKNYTAGWLGVDVSAYASRWLSCDPKNEKPFKEHKVGPNGSAMIWEPAKPDFKTMRFESWQAAADYTEGRVAQQKAA